ncbi:MAG: major capsid protein [Treponema sp.]|nr:major capsid protein [Treponema sp.]
MAVKQEITAALARYFTPQEVALVLKALPPLKTPVMDLVYPESRRRQKATPYISIAEIKDRTGAAPVVRKGTRSVPLDTGAVSGQLLEPEAFNPSIFSKASELNQLFALGMGTGVQAFIRDAIETLRNACREGTEIMAAQSLSGAIDYPMATESGSFLSYKVQYGTIKTLSAANIAGAEYGALHQILEETYAEQQNSGYAGKIRFLCAPDVYAAIINIVISKSAIPSTFTGDGLVIEGKYHILPFGHTYKKPGESNASPVIPEKFIQTIDLDAPHTLFYCAIDDLDANLAPMPFYAKPKFSDDPSGVKIIGNSKPLPAPVLSAMRRRKLLS